MLKIIPFILLLGLPQAYAANHSSTEIYYVRHAETVGNITHIHNKANDKTFSTTGENQVKTLTKNLVPIHFDHIIVSPKYRAMATILPYLKQQQRKAEVWPELAECCWQTNKSRAFKKLQRGSKIWIDSTMEPFFKFPDSDAQYKLKAKGYGEGMMRITLALDKIKERFAGSGKRILVIGHYHSGARIIEALQGKKASGKLQLLNAKISKLKETNLGKYKLLYINQ